LITVFLSDDGKPTVSYGDSILAWGETGFDILISILGGIVGIAIGLLISWLIMRNKKLETSTPNISANSPPTVLQIGKPPETPNIPANSPPTVLQIGKQPETFIATPTETPNIPANSPPTLQIGKPVMKIENLKRLPPVNKPSRNPPVLQKN